MTAAERIGIAALRLVDPETAHGLALRAAAAGMTPLPGPVASPRLATTLAGIALKNPLGLAAGFDKNATAIDALSRAGFGFVEVGAVTPRPQRGNPRPRLFRLPAERGAINRFGFNNDGMEAVADRLAAADAAVPVGLNLGANKSSEDRAADFAAVLARCGPHVDFATINVSSPNTEKLRELQGAEALRGVLAAAMEARAGLTRPVPVFLKIAPDLTDAEIAAIAREAERAGLHGIVATNTTLAREGLTGRHRGQTGGLSGAPLFARSTRVLARLAQETSLPLIGVGGIGSAGDAYAKIRAGATALQLYTALAYEGLSLVPRILSGLDALLARDGHASVADAVGGAGQDSAARSSAG